MARARLIKPGFFTNDELAEVDVFGRLLFVGLWTIADRRGRLEDRPKRIRAEIMPFDNVDVNALLEQLASRGFITRYTVDGLRLIQVEAFAKHQHPHFREPESLWPARGFGAMYEGEALGQPEALVPCMDVEPEASPSLAGDSTAPGPAVAVAVTSNRLPVAVAVAVSGAGAPDLLPPVIEAWTNATGQTITKMTADGMDCWIEKVGQQWVLDAITETNANGVKAWKYATSILERWEREGRDVPKMAAPPAKPKPLVVNQGPRPLPKDPNMVLYE